MIVFETSAPTQLLRRPGGSSDVRSGAWSSHCQPRAPIPRLSQNPELWVQELYFCFGQLGL